MLAVKVMVQYFCKNKQTISFIQWLIQKYHSFELKTLPVIYALRRFRVYLEGIQSTIVTDCNSLTLTLCKNLINPRIASWALESENYDYQIWHRRGELMAHADALCRAQIVAVIDNKDVDLNTQIV